MVAVVAIGVIVNKRFGGRSDANGDTRGMRGFANPVYADSPTARPGQRLGIELVESPADDTDAYIDTADDYGDDFGDDFDENAEGF